MRNFFDFLPFNYFDFKRSGHIKGTSLSIFVLAIFILSLSSLAFPEGKVQYLKKIGEIKEGFSSERENFFIKITGLCCDDEGNLYVADSGWNKIFKFDPNGKFLMSFGREGQGPGEFMAHPRRAHLKISFGNDGKLYVNDPGNSRISVFSKDGKFLKSHKTPPATYDVPIVNSRGDIYLLSPSGIKVLDRYDSDFKFMSSLLDIKEHFSFPYGKPPFPIPDRAFEGDVLKLITKKDEVILISNYSLRVFVFDKNDKKINEFEITEKGIRENCKKWNEKLRKDNMWLNPFEAFLDKNDNICINFLRIDNTQEIYVFNLRGNLIKILQFPQGSPIPRLTFSSDNKGRIFVPSKRLSNVEIFELSK